MSRRRWVQLTVGAVAVVVLVLGLLLLGPLRHRSRALADDVTGTSGSEDRDGWMAPGDDTLVFLAFTEVDGIVSGSAQVVTVTHDSTATIEDVTYSTSELTTEPAPLTGTLHDGRITLQIGYGVPWSGMKSASTLALNVPQTDGSLQQVEFAAASVADYNAAVSEMQAIVDQRNADAIAAARRDALIGGVARSAKAVRSGIALLETDLDEIATAAADVPVALEEEEESLDDVIAAKLDVLAAADQYPEGNYGAVCSDAAYVSTQASYVESDAAYVGSTARYVQTSIHGLLGHADELSDDYAALDAAMAAVPDLDPSDLPTSEQVASAVAAARERVASVVASTNALIDTANRYAVEAAGHATEALQTGACGSERQAQPPVAHIG
jgi:hypothetical protein